MVTKLSFDTFKNIDLVHQLLVLAPNTLNHRFEGFLLTLRLLLSKQQVVSELNIDFLRVLHELLRGREFLLLFIQSANRVFTLLDQKIFLLQLGF